MIFILFFVALSFASTSRVAAGGEKQKVAVEYVESIQHMLLRHTPLLPELCDLVRRYNGLSLCGRITMPVGIERYIQLRTCSEKFSNGSFARVVFFTRNDSAVFQIRENAPYSVDTWPSKRSEMPENVVAVEGQDGLVRFLKGEDFGISTVKVKGHLESTKWCQVAMGKNDVCGEEWGCERLVVHPCGDFEQKRIVATKYDGYRLARLIARLSKYTVATVDDNNTVCFWDTRPNAHEANIGSFKAGHGVVACMAGMSRYRAIVGCSNGALRLFDSRKKPRVRTFRNTEEVPVSNVAKISPRLFVSAALDGAVRVWDVHHDTCVQVLEQGIGMLMNLCVYNNRLMYQAGESVFSVYDCSKLCNNKKKQRRKLSEQKNKQLQ